MRSLVIYKQSLTISTAKWNYPYRKDGEKWIAVERKRLLPLYSKHDSTFLRGAIYRMKKAMEKMRAKNNRPIWNCKLSSKKVAGYNVYYLACERTILYNKVKGITR